MKKRGILLTIPFLLGLLVCFIPGIIARNIQSCEVILSQTITYQPKLSFRGEVSATQIKEVYLECPVIPSEVLVSVGDFVKKGDVLAHINTELTQTVLSQGVQATQTPDLSDFSQYEQYAELYGLSEAEIASVFANGSEKASVQPQSSFFVPSAVYAPMDGVITNSALSADVLCYSTQAAFTVQSQKGFCVKVLVAQLQIDEVKPGASVSISGEGMSQKTYAGVVGKISPVAQKVYTGLSSDTAVEVEIYLVSSDSDLKSGYQVTADILTGEQRDYPVLPYEAISQDEQNREYVWTVQNGRAHKKYIQTGRELPDAAEIISGICETDRILLAPGNIKENQLVRTSGGVLDD